MLDLALTSDGDLLLDSETRDIKVVSGNKLRIQNVICRIQSIQSDWFIDHIGADLEEILGQPNNESVISYGMSKIRTAITFDGLVTQDELYIKSESSENTVIKYTVYVKNIDEDTSTVLVVNLDLVKGVNTIIGW